MKFSILLLLFVITASLASQIFAQAEYSPLDSSGLIAFAGGSTTEGAGAVGVGLGGNVKGKGDFTFRYAYGRSNSRGTNQVGVQASFFLGRTRSHSNIFLAFHAAVDQLFVGAYSVTVYSPGLSAICMTNTFAKTSLVPSVSIGSHYSDNSPDGEFFFQCALGIRFLSQKGKCFYLEPGVGRISSGNHYFRHTTTTAFISLGWIGRT